MNPSLVSRPRNKRVLSIFTRATGCSDVCVEGSGSGGESCPTPKEGGTEAESYTVGLPSPAPHSRWWAELGTGPSNLGHVLCLALYMHGAGVLHAPAWGGGKLEAGAVLTPEKHL